MTNDFDTWIRQLDPATLQSEVENLSKELNEIKSQISLRLRALELLNAASPEKSAEVVEVTASDSASAEERASVERHPGIPTPGVFQVDRLIDPDSPREVRAMSEKVEILLGVLREGPPEGIPLKEIRRRLADRGIEFVGTPERGVLWRLEQQAEVEKPRQGVYRLPSPDGEETTSMR